MNLKRISVLFMTIILMFAFVFGAGAEDTPENAVQAPASETITSAETGSSEQPVTPPASETPNNPAGESSDQSANTPVQGETKEDEADNSNDASANNPADKPVDKPADSSTQKPDVTPTPKPVQKPNTNYASWPTATPAPETLPGEEDAAPELVKFTHENDQKNVYVFVFDAGYALYGSSFKDAIIKEAGDSEGEIIEFVKQATRVLVDSENIVIPIGYHSDEILVGAKTIKELLVASPKTQWQNRDYTDPMFDAILNEDVGQRKSSLFYSTNVTMESILGIINSTCKDYDINVIYVHGGVVQKVGGGQLTEHEDDISNTLLKIKQQGVSNTLLKIRQQGAKLYSVGLDWTDTKYVSDAAKYEANRVDQFFRDDERVSVPVQTSIGGEIERAETANRMIAEIIRILRGEQAAYAEVVPAKDKDVVSKVLELVDSNDLVVYTVTGADGKEYFAMNAWELKKALEATAFTENDALWLCTKEKIEGMIDFNQEKIFETVVEKIKSAVVHGIDKMEPDVEIEIPAELELTDEMFTADGKFVKCEIKDNKLVLSPAESGTGYITCRWGDYEIRIDVASLDSDIDWGWLADAEFSIQKSNEEPDALEYVNGENHLKSFNVIAKADELEWKIEEIIGEHAGAVAEGNSKENESCKISGINWGIGKGNDSVKTLKITFDRPGVYRISCVSQNSGHEEITESRLITIRMPADAKEKIELIAPYFKNQPQQMIDFTSSGMPVAIENYTVTISEGDVIDAYYTEDGNGMFIVPLKEGSAQIEIKEKYAENPEGTVINVEIKSLFSNTMLWVYAAGAVVSLIGLTVAITVIIGKAKRSK